METIENLQVLTFWRSDPYTGEFTMDEQPRYQVVEDGFDIKDKLQEWLWMMEARGWTLRQRTEWRVEMQKIQEEFDMSYADRRAVCETFVRRKSDRLGELEEKELRWLRNIAQDKLEREIYRKGLDEEVQKGLQYKLDALNHLQKKLGKGTFESLASLIGRATQSLDDDANFCDDIYNV